MFDQTFVNTHAQTRKSWTVLVSLTGQTLLVGTLMLIPLLHPEVLYPKIDTKIFLPVRSRPPAAQQTATHAVPTSHSFVPKVFTAPNIPKGVTQPRNVNMTAAPEGFAIAGAMPGTGTGGDAFSNLLQDTLPGPPAPEPKHVDPVKPAPPTGPIQVSSGVQSAKLLFGPKPGYPPLARAARVQGTVKIQAIIAADGTIGNLKTMSGPPLLINAAVEAVSRWRYQATLLNGRAVEVITEIDVIFTLGQ
jgi:protein TonB